MKYLVLKNDVQLFIKKFRKIIVSKAEYKSDNS